MDEEEWLRWKEWKLLKVWWLTDHTAVSCPQSACCTKKKNKQTKLWNLVSFFWFFGWKRSGLCTCESQCSRCRCHLRRGRTPAPKTQRVLDTNKAPLFVCALEVMLSKHKILHRALDETDEAHFQVDITCQCGFACRKKRKGIITPVASCLHFNLARTELKLSQHTICNWEEARWVITQLTLSLFRGQQKMNQ